MATLYAPRIVTDGLVLSLDAADSFSYASNTLDVEYLIVAGGGAGGFRLGGGGGAGGLLVGKTTLTTVSHSVVVGAGGAGNTFESQNNGVGLGGNNSSAFNITSNGGGGGGGHNGTAYVSAASGGSGGGGASNSNGGGGTTNQGTAGRNGNSGGISTNLPSGWNSDNGYNAGGGGGAGSQGNVGTPVSATDNPATAIPCNGGNGLLLNISGNGVYYGGGGGGHQYRNSFTNAMGGLGGGGRGGAGGYSSGQITFTTPTNGLANTGSGGGGGGYYSGEGGVSGAGGSGIVIIRYRGGQRASGGTVTTSNGWTIHTFTASGTFTVGTHIGDLSGNGNNGQLVNGPTFDSANGGSLLFDGINDYVLGGISNIFNNFSYDIWCKPTTTHEIDVESTSTTTGTAGQRYLIGPQNTGDTDAGSGISVGTNGISVYEHANGYMPPLLVYSTAINSIVHIVVNYTNKVPSLYLNGVFIKNGLTSPRANVKITTNLIGADTSYGYFSGNIYSAKFYNRSLTAQEVLQNYNATKGRYGL